MLRQPSARRRPSDSVDGSQCGNLVFGDFPNQVNDFAVTNGHVDVDGGTLIRLPMP